jgi:hypothetical protein
MQVKVSTHYYNRDDTVGGAGEPSGGSDMVQLYELGEPCDPENNYTLSLSLQDWNSSSTDEYHWQVKV